MVESYPIMDQKTNRKRETMGVVRPMYSRQWLLGPSPRHSIPEDGMPSGTAYHLVHDELIIDGGSRFNLARFCGIRMEPTAQELMAEAFDKNMVDKDEAAPDRIRGVTSARGNEGE
jgi:glutamate decarboxylase